MIIRPVQISDSSAILDIYNPFIESSVVTFEYDLLEVSDIEGRIEKLTNDGFPWLVSEVEGKVVGYAYASTWRSRIAYKYTVESAIYIAPDFVGRGIGKRLYRDLFEELKIRGFRMVIAGLTLPNEASQAIHKSLGFQRVGTYNAVGFKFDRWLDTEFWQLDLGVD